ncbi:MAG: CRISPR-associated endonuclease Cas1 [Anaerolineales bacterium]|nr:CRISPR-associated endonuclease Cas1 [Anaerolineales bacterium]
MAIVRHLVVDEYGAHVGKYSERLKVTQKGQTLSQASLLHLESLVIANQGVSISAEAIRECTERGIPIHFISGSGTPYASLYSAGLTGTAATRRAQLQALNDSRGLHLALDLAIGKLGNQVNLLKYIAKYRKESDPELYNELRLSWLEVLDQQIELEKMRQYPEVMEGSATLDGLRAEIMGLEGQAARRYWHAVGRILPEQYAFPGRVGRGAQDPVNAALNYGYGILYGQVERCLVLAGLDPYSGFLHVDRPGKPSLTLDFIEEFRQPVVDRTVIGMANKGMAFEQDERALLTKEFRRTLAGKVQERLDSQVAYEDKRHSLQAVMQMQARHLAVYLRGERPAYRSYQMAW